MNLKDSIWDHIAQRGNRDVLKLPLKLDKLELLLLYLFELKRKEVKPSVALQPFKWLAFFVLKVHMTKVLEFNRKDWHTISMSLPKKLDSNECKNTIRNLNGTDSAELNEFFFIGYFNYFDRLSFQVQVEKKQMPFILINQLEHCTHWCVHITTKKMTRLLILQSRSQDVEMISIIIFTKLAGHQDLKKFLRTMMIK